MPPDGYSCKNSGSSIDCLSYAYGVEARLFIEGNDPAWKTHKWHDESHGLWIKVTVTDGWEVGAGRAPETTMFGLFLLITCMCFSQDAFCQIIAIKYQVGIT